MTRTSAISEHAHNIRHYTRSENHHDPFSCMHTVKVAILITRRPTRSKWIEELQKSLGAQDKSFLLGFATL